MQGGYFIVCYREYGDRVGVSILSRRLTSFPTRAAAEPRVVGHGSIGVVALRPERYFELEDMLNCIERIRRYTEELVDKVVGGPGIEPGTS